MEIRCRITNRIGVKDSVGKKQRENAANKLCSRLKGIFNCSSKTWSPPIKSLRFTSLALC
jgi:hypothetical protein